MHPFKLGLTGSIGMGKSTTAAMFAAAGIPVFDSDAIVHELYAKGGAGVGPVSAVFPESVENGAISRARLTEILTRDPAGFEKLNAIVHPLVTEKRVQFLDQARKSEESLVVFDIPLLFETGADALVDGILVVTAPHTVQRERVLARNGMTEAKFANILSRQIPDAEKRARADFIIDTSQGIGSARKAVDAIIDELKTSANRGRR